jgi:cell wall-associated NlpC family hydrolase
MNGRALAATSIGVLFVWSGIKGWSVLGTIGDVITGKKPSQTVAYPLQVAGKKLVQGGDSGFGPATPSGGIASIGMQYIGHAYRFGGAPGRNAQNPWDCSSFVNYVVGVKARMAIPGNPPGRYTGTTHGPPTAVWASWTGMDTIKRSEVQAGDIILWLGHMGIAINNAEVVNALNPRDKTKVTNINQGVGRGPLVRCGRLR